MTLVAVDTLFALSVLAFEELESAFAWARANCAVLETRLLKAGHPLHPC
jgi:hypothetical protein